MSILTKYDVAIAGGGLAGLTLAIQCRRAGLSVVLFEKETYPFHRVCGEYISLESWNFLQDLGVPLSDLHLPIINRLQVTSADGNHLEHSLPLGGFGISRFMLDDMLASIAKREGVVVKEKCRVTDIRFVNNHFQIFAGSDETTALAACGTFGKRSNLDIKWKRNFILRRPNKLNHYIGVKYHIRYQHDADLIALHNFKDGYCGISKIENNQSCLCYLTTASNLKRYGGDIRKMEQHVLYKNPFLKKIFTSAEFIYPEPLTISQVSFNRKSQVENHVLMVGDAAGLITPLCGNGMSMAIHASKLAFEETLLFINESISRFEMEQEYSRRWEQQFGKRIQAGRIIQRFFGGNWQSRFFIAAIKPFPKLISTLIRQTHGQPF